MSEAALLQLGPYTARIATTRGDIAAAQGLRRACFGPGETPDRFDGLCRHVVIRDAAGAVAGTFRLRLFEAGAGIRDSYTGQFYDLSPLAARRGPMMELGRFCIRPGAADPDLLRLAWAALTALADRAEAVMLFGCSSLPGTDPAAHAPGLALLADRYLAPPAWRPGRRVACTVPLAGAGAPPGPGAAKVLPSLLRSYLAMGARVSDHAVIDTALGTLHVFTGLEVAAIPPARLRALRAMTGETGAQMGRGAAACPLAGGRTSA